jgi:ferredoxin
MAFSINMDTCTSCGACEDECPSKAISHKGKVYVINPKKCTECEGSFDTQQCAEVCPSGSCEPLAA